MKFDQSPRDRFVYPHDPFVPVPRQRSGLKIQRQATHRLTLNLESASLSWDWDEGVVRVYEALAGRLVEFHQPKLSAHVGYHQNIGEAMYIDEIGSFLAAASGRAEYPHNLQDDIRVLELLESMENTATA